jgi:hypothetical protein
MAGTCSELPSENRSVQDWNTLKWTAQRGWVCTGVKNDLEAYAAVPLRGFDPIPKPGDSHPLNKALRVQSRSCDPWKGPLSRIVKVYYQVLSSDAVIGPNPLNQPWTIYPELVATSEPMEVEPGSAQDNPLAICDSAGILFNPGPNGEVFDILISITRNEPFYPLQKSLQFKNTTNKGNYTIPQIGTVTDGQLLCLPIRAGEPYTSQSLYVPVIYSLRARIDGWRIRMLDRGYQGWYNDKGTPKRGPFVDLTNTRVSDPVLLNGKGAPLEPNIFKVLSGADLLPKTPINAPVNKLKGDYIDNSQTPAGGAVFLKYRQFRSVLFDGLL